MRAYSWKLLCSPGFKYFRQKTPAFCQLVWVVESHRELLRILAVRSGQTCASSSGVKRPWFPPRTYENHRIFGYQLRQTSLELLCCCRASASLRLASRISSICLLFIILLSICPSLLALTIAKIVIMLSCKEAFSNDRQRSGLVLYT